MFMIAKEATERRIVEETYLFMKISSKNYELALNACLLFTVQLFIVPPILRWFSVKKQRKSKVRVTKKFMFKSMCFECKEELGELVCFLLANSKRK